MDESPAEPGVELDPRLAANRANWDARVPIHLGPGGYGIERYATNADHLSGTVLYDRDRLGDLTGLRVVHLQCHIGNDTVSLARLGAAEVVGVDFSTEAVAAARSLADDAGANARFVLSDVYRAAEAVGETVDLVYTSVGTIGWLDDINRWAANVAGLLRPGGRFVFRDLHPALWVYEEVDGDVVPHFPYWQRRDEPLVFDDTESYLGEGTIASPRTYEWNHTVAEVINALIGAGLRIDRIDEHDDCEWQPFPSAPARGDRYVLPEPLAGKIPMMWSIGATKQAS